MTAATDFLNAYQTLGSQYAPVYGLAQQTYGVPASVLAAQDYQESTFGTKVGNGGGIAQFEPATIKSLDSSIAQVQNPSIGIMEQAAYMSKLIAANGGNIANALSAYNTGSANSTTGQQYAAKIISNANSLGDSSTVAGQLSASQLVSTIPGASTTVTNATNDSASTNAKCPSISLSPSSWLEWGKCEGFNLLLMLLGIIGVVTALKSLFNPDLASVAVSAASLAE